MSFKRLIQSAVMVAPMFCLLGISMARAQDSIDQRIEARTYPSVFQAWNRATKLPGKSAEEMTAMHDLFFAGTEQLGLKWDSRYRGEGTQFTPESIRVAEQRAHGLRKLNPNLIILAELNYRDAPPSFLAKDSPYWLRDGTGTPVIGWPEGGYFKIDFSSPAFCGLTAKRAEALVKSGVVDGVMLDWWSDGDDRLKLVKAVRQAVGDKLILVNSNDKPFPLTAAYVNGTFMECTKNWSPQDWGQIASTLRWAEQHTRAPHIDCLETWFHHSRQDFSLMRATTTLSLTQSDGYCLFSDPDYLPTPDHLHDWYSFWDKGLGVPTAPGAELPDKSWRREFTNGTAIYNPMGNAEVAIHFAEPRLSRATGQVANDFRVPPCDGDIFMRQAPAH